MIARLGKKETDTAQATDQTVPATDQTVTATTNLAATTKKISSAGLRAVSPVRDHAASLTGQHALNVALLPLSDWSDCHPKAIECVRVLKVALTLSSVTKRFANSQQQVKHFHSQALSSSTYTSTTSSTPTTISNYILLRSQ